MNYNHITAYSANPNSPMPGTSMTPNDMFDLTNQPGGVKVCYIPSFRWIWYKGLLATLNIDQISDLPETSVTLTSPNWPSSVFFNMTTIVLQETARNSRPNILNRTEVLESDTIAQSTGIGLDLTNFVGQYDATGCIGHSLPTDINDRCDNSVATEGTLVNGEIATNIGPSNVP